MMKMHLRVAALLLGLLVPLGAARAQSGVGTPTDPAWNGTATAATLVSIEKAVYGIIGTILGAPSDAAWSGSGSGTLIAIQKATYALINSPVPTCSGSPNCVGAIGGFNLMDAGGTNVADSTNHAVKVETYDGALPSKDATVGTTNTDVGPPGATACATDTGSCSLNALLQRIAQRLTSILTGPVPVSAASLPLPTNGAQETGGNLATIAGAITSSVVQSNVKQVNGITVLTGAGATGTGAQRVTTAQDTTTIAGSAPGTAGTPSAQVVTIQGIGSMTKLLVTPDANSTVNETQLNGTTVDTNSGNKSAGTQRIVIATDQPNLTTPLNVAGTVQPGNTPNTTPWLANPTSQYPSGSTAITGSATGTTAATTATLPALASNYTYVCGYSIRANATAAVTVNDTLTGVITGTLNSTLWVAPNASGLGVDEQIFSPCIPSSAVNTAISAVSGAPGTGGVVSAKIWGYYKTTTP